jgi:hypothetical protein
MIGRSLAFEGYGASVRLDMPYRMDLASLKSYVAPELSVEECTDGPPDLLLTCWNGVCHLVVGERRYGPFRTEDNVFRGVANGIHYLIAKRSPMTFLHAAAVELDGGAVVFPGRSRSGRSTLAATLVGQGCGYLSDEYAVVSPEGTVFPLSKPIRLRCEDGAHYLNPPGVGAPGGLSCQSVILTRYERGAAWNPKPLSTGRAILGVLASAARNLDAPDQVLQAVSSMVRAAICYEVVRGEGEQPTAMAIRELEGVAGLRDKAEVVS